MATLWKWRIMIFIRASDNTAQNRQSFAQIFVNNNSGETLKNEAKLFNSVTKLSVSGELPAQVFGINVPVKAAMRDALRTFIDALPQCRYYVVCNTATETNFDGKLVLDNKEDAGESTLVGVAPWDVQPFTWADALADLLAERGLQVIPDESEI